MHATVHSFDPQYLHLVSLRYHKQIAYALLQLNLHSELPTKVTVDAKKCRIVYSLTSSFRKSTFGSDMLCTMSYVT